MEELIVEWLVPVDAPAYRDYADRESLFAMVIPLVPEQGRFLIAHHRWRDTWELPSGKVEPGERPTQTAERELLEEMGAQVDRLRPLGILLTRLGKAPGQGHLYWGEVIRWGDLPRGSEMDEVRAFSPDMLLPAGRMAPVTRWVVRWIGCRLITPTEPWAIFKERGTSWIWD